MCIKETKAGNTVSIERAPGTRVVKAVSRHEFLCTLRVREHMHAQKPELTGEADKSDKCIFGGCDRKY